MATEVVKIVDPDGGGDYSSATAWEADFGTCTQSNYPSMSGDGDLEGADLIAVADCRCTSGSADTNAVTIDGWTSTGADNYIKIWTDPDQGYRHDGKWNTNVYRTEISTSGNANILIKESYTKVQGLQVRTSTGNDNYQYGIRVESEAGNVVISHCIVKCGNTSAAYSIGIKIHSGAGDYNGVYNNIVYGFSGTDQSGIENSKESYIYNNTVVNNNKGIKSGGWKGARAKNNLAFNNTDDYDCPYWSEAVYNAYSEGTDPGTNGLDISSYAGADIFADYNNNDFHLKSNSLCKDAGTDLSSDPNLAFTDDIDGETRSGTWDIGADEYVEAGGGTSIEIGSMSLVFAGQNVSTSLDITQEIPKMALLLTGQSVHHAISVTKEITATALSWTGKTLGLNCTIHPAKMALSWAGQAVKTSTGVTVEIAKATLSWAGKSVSLNKTFKIAKMTLIWAGKIPGIGGIISWGIHRLGLDLTIEM